jgi:DNA polymerase-3 subunit chi
MNKTVFIELPIPKKNRYVCDIAEKFYEEGKKVHIYASKKEDALQLSRDLWVWKQNSFVPHTVHFGQNGLDEDYEPVIITTVKLGGMADAIILFDPLKPEELSGYETVVDFAEVYDETRRNESRKRFKAFRDDGHFEVHFAKIGAFLKDTATGD